MKGEFIMDKELNQKGKELVDKIAETSAKLAAMEAEINAEIDAEKK